MSANSKIEWTEATSNPVRRRRKISPGCKHCYASVFAERFRCVPGHPLNRVRPAAGANTPLPACNPFSSNGAACIKGCAGRKPDGRTHDDISRPGSGRRPDLLKPRGLLAQRYIHKKVLELPIPPFDSPDARHQRLAELSEVAHAEASRAAPTLTPARLPGRRLSEMREALCMIPPETDGTALPAIAGPV